MNSDKSGIGNIGWSSTTSHKVVIPENAEAYAICKPNTGYHYRIGAVTHIKKVEASKSNVTCKACLKKMKVA